MGESLWQGFHSFQAALHDMIRSLVERSGGFLVSGCEDFALSSLSLERALTIKKKISLGRLKSQRIEFPEKEMKTDFDNSNLKV